MKKWQKAWTNKQSNLVNDYDRLHNIYIPKRNEMLSLINQYSEFEDNEVKRFIDIGAGTGAASFTVLNKYNDAKAIMIDGSAEMLKTATSIAEENNFNVQAVIQDLSVLDWVNKANIDGEYPLIISSLMIHHLTDDEKKRFIKDIYLLLKPSGRFIYVDVLKMENAQLEDFHFNLWVQEIIRNKQNEKLESKTFEEEKSSLYNAVVEQGDMPATEKYILDCFKEAGFKNYSIVWFYLKFGFFIAEK